MDWPNRDVEVLPPTRIIDVSTTEYGRVRIRVYPQGIIIERQEQTLAYIKGTAVPDWLVERRAEDIDLREFFRLQSPRVRSRFVSKVGLRRLLTELNGRVADRQTSDRLIVFEDQGRRRVYLMSGWRGSHWHMEQVDPALTSVNAAWEWIKRREQERLRRERQARGIRC